MTDTPAATGRNLARGCALITVTPFLGGLALWGLLHLLRDYFPPVPTPSYWWCLTTLFLARWVFGSLRGNGAKAFVDLAKAAAAGLKALGEEK